MKNKPNFMIIISDCTRPDKLSCYGYEKNITPNIDNFAKQGTIFLNAVTQGVWTLPTHASLFSGQYPFEHGLYYATEDLDIKLKNKTNILTNQLKKHGYITAGISNNPWVGKLSRMDKDFDFFMESDGATRNNLDLDINLPIKISMMNQIQKKKGSFFFKLLIPYLIKRPEFTDFSIETAKKIINYSKKNNKPFFIFMNLMDTHQPYYPPLKILNKISEKRYYPFSSIVDNIKIRSFFQGNKSEKTIKILNDYYNASLNYQDKQIGNLFDFMKKNNSLDNTVIFFTSDHGKNLGEYDIDDDINYVKDIILKVPLIVRYPRLFPKNKKIINNVQLIDINYTIKKILGIKTNHSFDVSLLDSIKKEKNKFCYSEAKLPYTFFNNKEKDLNFDYIEIFKNKDRKFFISKNRGYAHCKYSKDGEDFIYNRSSIDDELLEYFNEQKERFEFSEKKQIKDIVKNKIIGDLIQNKNSK